MRKKSQVCLKNTYQKAKISTENIKLQGFVDFDDCGDLYAPAQTGWDWHRGSALGALWERCGSAVGALWEHCGTTVAALWGRCIPAVGQNITQNIKKCVFPIPSQ